MIALAMATISASGSPSAMPNCAARTSSAARNVNSVIPAPRGSTMTIRSRRLRVRRPIPTTPASAIAAPITRSASTAIGLLHQALRGKTHHLAQQLGVGALLQQRTQAHHFVGDRRGLVWVRVQLRPTMTTAVDKWPPPPDSWRSLRRATYPQLLHHSEGHDPDTRHRRSDQRQVPRSADFALQT